MSTKEITKVTEKNIVVIEDESGPLEETNFSLPQTVDYLDMERQYRQLMYLHEAAIQQITAKLNILKGEFQFSNDRNPISSISSRIKSKESIIYKMQKKGLPMTASALLANVHDIAGVRVVCPFIEDVYYVARMLVKQHDIEVIEVKDYIRQPKENGYRSLHLIVTVQVYFSETTKNIPVEIQIRTIAMDFWASTEHQLRYKKDREFTEEAQRKLKHCADLMALADEEMQEIAGTVPQDW
ncbi:MAG: GTP pyrophosphokinase family protein [Agathobacter sp.]|nr:GTP pyrophosphokinase family protein [Agathobacter sp.]MDY3887642.1 GTP pyrophosphokinase family protein [Agathobacter sp.]